MATKHHYVRPFLLIVFLTGTAYSATPMAPKYDELIQQGKSQLQAGSALQAAASGRAAIKMSAERWEGYALVGGALINLKRYDEAIDLLTKAIELAPEAKQAALRDLRRQSHIADSAATKPTEAGAVKATSQAEVVLWKTIESSGNPGDFQTYLDQYPHGAFVALAQRHLVEAKYPPEAVNTSAPPTKTGVLSRDLNKPMIAASKAMKDGNYDEAIVDLQAAQAVSVAKSDYDNFTITSWLAMVYLKKQMLDNAVPLLLQAAHSDYASSSQQRSWLKGAAMAYYNQKDFSRALDVANEAATHGGGDPIFLQMIAMTQEHLGKYNDAALTMQVAVNRQANPDEKMLGLLKDMKSKAEIAAN
jgi:tetratricopeptide (TPR) repeat protein